MVERLLSALKTVAASGGGTEMDVDLAATVAHNKHCTAHMVASAAAAGEATAMEVDAAGAAPQHAPDLAMAVEQSGLAAQATDNASDMEIDSEDGGDKHGKSAQGNKQAKGNEDDHDKEDDSDKDAEGEDVDDGNSGVHNDGKGKGDSDSDIEFLGPEGPIHLPDAVRVSQRRSSEVPSDELQTENHRAASTGTWRRCGSQEGGARGINVPVRYAACW